MPPHIYSKHMFRYMTEHGHALLDARRDHELMFFVRIVFILSDVYHCF